MEKAIHDASQALRSHLDGISIPEIVVVLGSGFAVFKDSLEVKKEIDLSQVEGLKTPKVQGHGSNLVVGEKDGVGVAVLTGRIHMYEGHSAGDAVFNLRVLKELGMKKVLLTNASGGLTKKHMPGQIVVIKDHINFTGQNCLTGCHDFIDMSKAYSPDWVKEISGRFNLKSAVYVGVLGPSFETPAETRMFASFADVVGMSTVQETICSVQMGVKVMALSMVTNLTGGLGDEVEHEEVLKMAQSNNDYIVEVMSGALTIMSQ